MRQVQRYRSGLTQTDNALADVSKDIKSLEDLTAGVSGAYTVAELAAITDGSIILAACSNATGGPTVAVFVSPTWYNARTGLALS